MSLSPEGGTITLYQRLGAYDVIAAIVDDLFAALRNDPRFSRFGTGRSLDSRERARQLFVDQMCALTGGPCIYIGRDMTTSYGGLGITDAEWEANKGHTAAVLDRHESAEPRRPSSSTSSRGSGVRLSSANSMRIFQHRRRAWVIRLPVRDTHCSRWFAIEFVERDQEIQVFATQPSLQSLVD